MATEFRTIDISLHQIDIRSDPIEIKRCPEEIRLDLIEIRRCRIEISWHQTEI